MAIQHTARTRRTACRASARVVRKLGILEQRMRDTAQDLDLIGRSREAGELRSAATIANLWASSVEIAARPQRVAA